MPPTGKITLWPRDLVFNAASGMASLAPQVVNVSIDKPWRYLGYQNEHFTLTIWTSFGNQVPESLFSATEQAAFNVVVCDLLLS